MNQHPHQTIRATFTRMEVKREAPAEPIDDSFWLGGEAMVAPGCFFDLPAEHEIADPVWLTI